MQNKYHSHESSKQIHSQGTKMLSCYLQQPSLYPTILSLTQMLHVTSLLPTAFKTHIITCTQFHSLSCSTAYSAPPPPQHKYKDL